jgi:hypothetical protein
MRSPAHNFRIPKKEGVVASDAFKLKTGWRRPTDHRESIGSNLSKLRARTAKAVCKYQSDVAP